MNRIEITDGSGSWFDADKATEYRDATFWNGSNHIHMTTRDQWSGQSMYRTASGKWVLQEWSARDGCGDSYDPVSDDFAARWLSANGHSPDVLAGQIAEMEL